MDCKVGHCVCACGEKKKKLGQRGGGSVFILRGERDGSLGMQCCDDM